ncbi:DUF1850 domain-containing protein [uncultured Desulfosarcina sp.]|uniref:DUF1850 domain-containing protein n=1 Tax=uncultured Desulfosarcina sp. TaxID=218289 RepID=UPI0029C71954|nr:DUF1850 domain-containing protein [uncultured Desulfosarcina sp.]
MKPVIAGVLALLLAACTASGVRPDKAHPCLTLSRFPSCLILGQYPLPGDGAFSLSFIHSVSQTPVRDDYQTLDSRIIQTAETFQAHGAGLPSGTDETGVTGWEHHDGHFIIRMQRPIHRLIVRTDRNYRNRLHIDGKEIDLNAWEDQALELAIVPCTAP